MRSEKYVIGLDLVRFFAASAVLVFHLVYMIGIPSGDSYKISGGIVAYPEIGGIPSYGWIGVQIFFVLSGFVILLSAENVTGRRFLHGRVLRLVPAAWICATISLFCLLISDNDSVSEYIIKWAKSVLFSPAGPYIDHVYWTLGVEIAFYAIVLLFISAGKTLWLSPFMLIVAVVSAVFNFGDLVFELLPAPDRFSELTMLRYGVFFAIGVGLHRWWRLGLDKLVYALISVGILGSIAQITWNMRSYDEVIVPQRLFWLLSFWLGILALMFASVLYNKALVSRLGKHAHVIRSLGLITYPLYLVHQTVGAILIAAFVGMGLGRYPALLIAVSIVLLLAWLIVRFEATLRATMEPPFARVLARLPFPGEARS
ncbi:acyltransferase family protein [Shinella sedimenti]|uniref:Acyltransferase n=1 Tax=Shinella sedimenti TaxID=2919913 RepID=A0ABT0CFZ6_9HYPH|nr:acyltransferase [Shinella sedimenti]MCJ8147535.1 acyltransferase [Shinella sedimenti]